MSRRRPTPLAPPASPRVVRTAVRGDKRLFWALACLALAVYLATLYPGIPGGDSGEFILVAQQHGVAHPPGYPLYSILANLVALLPGGSVAWRINALSALCAAAAVGVLAALLQRLTASRSASLLGAGLFAFAPTVWTTAVAAEVFALHNLLLLLFLHALLSACVVLDNNRAGGKPLDVDAAAALRRSLGWGGLWAGLGLANHHVGIFVVAPAAACVGVLCWRRRAGRYVGIACVGLALGLLPYLYLPWAAAVAPEHAWADTARWEGWLAHVLRRDYGTFSLAHADLAGNTSWLSKAAVYLRSFAGQWLGLGVLLVVYGSWAGRAPRLLRQLLLFCWATYVATLLALSNLPFEAPLFVGIAERLWQQGLCLAAPFLACGWAALWQRWPRRRRLPLAIAVALVALQLGLHWRQNDRHDDDLFAQLAENTLRPLPRHAAVLASGDHLVAALHYVQQVQGVRPDVDVVDAFTLLRQWGVRQNRRLHPTLRFPGAVYLPTAPPGTFDLPQWIAANLPQRRLFVANGLRLVGASLGGRTRLWPEGAVEEILPIAQEKPLALWLQQDAHAEAALRPLAQAAGRYLATSWEREVQRRLWQERHGMAAALYHYARRHDGESRRTALAAAIARFEQVWAQAPQKDPQVLKNLGAAYQDQISDDPTATQKRCAAWERYLALAPPSDPDLPLIKNLCRPRP